MDVMLYLFACLRETRKDKEALSLSVRDFYGVIVPKDDVQNVHELRETVDLSELYSRVKVFFFFLFLKRFKLFCIFRVSRFFFWWTSTTLPKQRIRLGCEL